MVHSAWSVALIVISGMLGIVVGALIQQEATFRNIKSSMGNDAYIHYRRQEIFDALRLVFQSPPSIHKATGSMGRPTERDFDPAYSSFSGNQSDQQAEPEHRVNEYSVLGNFIRWWQLSLETVAMRFSNTMDDRETQPELEPLHLSILMKYGFPGMNDIHIYRNFVLSYDRRNRIAHWVCEHVTSACLQGTNARIVKMPTDFLVDTNMPLIFRAHQRDYQDNAWIGGQLASPHNHNCDPITFLETFLQPNIAPFNYGLKSKLWARLEEYVRELAIKFGSVYVYTGPLFLPERQAFRNWIIRHSVIGANTVAVPTHFFKVIIIEFKDCVNSPYMEGYVVPNMDVNNNVDLSNYVSNIEDIEHFAGLKFYDGAYRSHIYQNSLFTEPLA